jgi:hypothetical protein
VQRQALQHEAIVLLLCIWQAPKSRDDCRSTRCCCCMLAAAAGICCCCNAHPVAAAAGRWGSGSIRPFLRHPGDNCYPTPANKTIGNGMQGQRRQNAGVQPYAAAPVLVLLLLPGRQSVMGLGHQRMSKATKDP